MMSMMMTPSDTRAYKAIVVLNNSGITLLQRQRYQDALVTFRETIDIMKCIRDGTTQNDRIDTKQALYLNRTSKRISQSTQVMMDPTNTVNQDTSSSTEMNTSNLSLTVLTQHDQSNTSEILSPYHGVTLDCCIVHLLDFVDIASVNLNQDTAIILHNFSVAIRVQLPTELSNGTISHLPTQQMSMFTKYIDFAFKMTNAADTILNEQIEQLEMIMYLSTTDVAAVMTSSTSEQLYQEQYIEALQLSIIVVQDLHTLSSMIHPASNALTHYYHGRLSQTRSSLKDKQDSYQPPFFRRIPAAKAA
jgi:hypothetical protein